MPSDRHEALHLILGFCKDHGLLETYRSLCWEAGLDASSEELAPHVSLMRVLLDWKKAFQQRFSGTPRIIAPVPKPEPVAHMAHAAPALLHQQISNSHQATFGNAGSMQHADAMQQQQQQQQQQYSSLLPTSSQELANGSVQTIATFTMRNGSALNNQAGQMWRQQQPTAHYSAQGAPSQFVLAPSQPLDGAQQTTLHGPQMSIQGQHSGLQHHNSMPARHTADDAGVLHALPPRPLGALPSHSSSLYSAPDGHTTATTGLQHDCSQDASPDEWQGHEGDETGNSAGMGGGAGGGGAGGRHWGHAGNANGGGGGLVGQNSGQLHSSMHPSTGGGLSAAARRSSSGSLAPVTKLKKGSEPISQATFLTVITQVGPGAVASQLFDFRRPQRGTSATARRSAILQLTDAQHDAMYALAGCEDVNFLISNVTADVRLAMHQVFEIDKESFTVWFKNRGRNPSKAQHRGAAGAAAAFGGVPTAGYGGGESSGLKRMRSHHDAGITD